MTDVGELHGRVTAATGPDRELDRAIGELFDECDYSGPALTRPLKDWAKPYTSSVDAALALVERVLPGWRLQLTQDPDLVGWWANLVPMATQPTHSEQAATPALAILAALLTALSKGEQSPNHLTKGTCQ